MLALISLPAAAAQANATWTGASSSPEWSTRTNWSGTPPSSNRSVGTLSFPTLGTCGTCYASHNGLTGVSATGLVFANRTGQYQILGNSLTIGAGGISDTAGGGTGDQVDAPLALSGAQSWIMGSALNGYNSLSLLGGVTGSSADGLTLSMPVGDLFVDSDMEVGPVTSNGPGGLHIGGAPGLNRPGSINGSDGQPVTIDGGALIANLGSTSGPLAMNNATTLLLGTNPQNNGTTSLSVHGTASLGPSTTTETFIDADGPAPAIDFSQLSASGNIVLGGRLVVGQGPNNGTCAVLTPGDVATLIVTSGTLSGSYSNAPEGSTLTMTSSCQSPAPQVQIRYTANSVTATVVGATSPPPPGVSARTRRASGITTTRATLNGTVATAGRAVRWQFQYGTSRRYDRATPLRMIRAGQSRPISVRWTVRRLSANTRYDYRLVVAAQTSPGAPVGTAAGRNETFTTRATGRLILGARSLRVSGRSVLVPLTCRSRLRCTGRFGITTTATRQHRRETVVCASGSFRLRAHRSSTLRARLRGGCLALLRSGRHHRLSARFTSRPRTGQRGATERITLRRRSRK